MKHSWYVIMLFCGITSLTTTHARKIAAPAGPSYAALMKTTPVVTKETQAVAAATAAPISEPLPAATTPLPTAHPAQAVVPVTAPAIMPVDTNDQRMIELKKQIATHLIDNTLGSYHRARIMQFNSRMTLLEAKKDEYSQSEISAELANLSRDLDGVFEEAQLEKPKDVTIFVNSTDTVTASNLVTSNGIPTSGNNTNVFLIINRSEAHHFAPILYRVMFKQPTFHFNTPYAANKDVLWQHESLGQVSRAVVATPQQILDDPYFADKPLPAEMIATLKNPGTHTHYDVVRKKMADGSYRRYQMGNMHGWIVPVPTGKIVSGTAPTADSLGLAEKVAALPPHGDPASERTLKLLVEYQFTPIAQEGAQAHTPETGTALVDSETPFVMPVAGATITKAFFGYGPDLEHFINNGQGLDTNGNMMWYTSARQAEQLYHQYHKKMIAKAEAQQVAKQQAVLEELAYKSAREEEDGERRVKGEHGSWFALYKNDKTTGEESLIGWFTQTKKDGAALERDLKALWSQTTGNNTNLSAMGQFSGFKKKLDTLMHLENESDPTQQKCFILPNGYKMPNTDGFTITNQFVGFGPDFEARLTNQDTTVAEGYSPTIYGPHFKRGYELRDKWIAAGYPKAPVDKSGGKPSKGGLANFGSGFVNMFTGVAQIFTGDVKTD